MATSESDDFESADEEMDHDISKKKRVPMQQWCVSNAIDSESDDDTEFVPQTPYTNTNYNRKAERKFYGADTLMDEKKSYKETIKENKDTAVKDMCDYKKNEQSTNDPSLQEKTSFNKNEKLPSVVTTSTSDEKEIDQEKLSTEELETEIPKNNNLTDNTIINVNQGDKLTRKNSAVSKEVSLKDELSELEMPEEMKSDKKFKEVFKPEGWEGLGNEIELPEELTEEKLQPILKRLSLAGQETQNSSKGWGWGNWGVSSLIDTATAGVSTLTSHVSHGLTLLEESITTPEESNATKMEEENSETNVADNKTEESEEYSSFGFGNFISGVSSITKLVESTGTKVMTGGLDTLEAIGKKTMEVLQEGDPGLKKKRAFFMNEADKPILSQVLREAKDKADAIEKTIEEKQKMRKIHFESLFDDYQGLVHLEALEMLSKQSSIKIQQHLSGLSMTELNSVQETLEEVKELCDLGEVEENKDEVNDLKIRLQEACNNLGIVIAYEKLHDVCKESEVYLAPPVTHTDQEIFVHAISVLAQFTAFSMERFHKTAELLLIKEHRSTVNEADALVHLTHILSNQIGILANSYCSSLNSLFQVSDKLDIIKSNITTIFMEASNASSYVQDAFKLLIPIIQVGAI
ncbi:protein FAM114A2 [Hylaeus anthracinus]|uniref:protein FAM114A2 n=1 Tax=Hylaeus anthracinus TaxID=313031 RepID=UPI0023B9A2E8|nr:protein FAM114A2 [Hylaeus anthracinus]XP_054010735.1 protein FAM114A2 [Hylaeus anthracinus]XP_054010736.1 protein FAM114A2 [Hylaeus anthracinus]